MQTPKSRARSLEVPQRTSPATPHTARRLKTPVSESDSGSSSQPASRTPKGSPKIIERRSPRSPITELQKKRPSRVSELESQLSQLQDELKKTKDLLNSSESCKKGAQQEAEESKKQLAAISVKLEESQQQLLELSASEEARVQELHKISEDRNHVLQSELEAVQKQHSIDSAALASAMNEIQKLTTQLDSVTESEAARARHAESAQDEIHCLKRELSETLALVENLKTQLGNSKESETQAQEFISETQILLETAMSTEDTLRSESLKAMESYKSLASELEQSKAQVNLLEGLVTKLEADLSACISTAEENGENGESNKLKAELSHAKSEVDKLLSALDAAERRYHEDYIQSTLQIRSAYELVEHTKLESGHREAALEARLKQTEADIEELKVSLMTKETKLQSISDENEVLKLKVQENQTSGKESVLESDLEKSEACLADLKSHLLDKETEFQNIIEENEMLKKEIEKKEIEKNKVNDEALALAESARAAEREALMKLGYLTEEADKSSRKAARVAEQLDAAQATNSEMEAELRRLKVQSDQWRKAAEAAASMLSTGNNGKYVVRTGSLDSNYHTIRGKLGSPFSEDMDDETPKKKSGNVLKKIGVLLRKGQK